MKASALYLLATTATAVLGLTILNHTRLCAERGGRGPINADDRGGVTCLYDTQLLGACLHASESCGRYRPEAVRGMPERAVPPPGPQRQAVASSTRVDASSQDKPDGSSGGRAPGTGWAGLLTMEAGPLSRPSFRPTSGSIKPTTRRNWKRFAGACKRPPLWPAGMAEGNRATFGPRVGLSSHGSPAKGGPKSKCLARVKIARTSAGLPSLTISDLSRFPPVTGTWAWD